MVHPMRYSMAQQTSSAYAEPAECTWAAAVWRWRRRTQSASGNARARPSRAGPLGAANRGGGRLVGGGGRSSCEDVEIARYTCVCVCEGRVVGPKGGGESEKRTRTTSIFTL